MNSILDKLQQHSTNRPNATAFTYLDDTSIETSRSFYQLKQNCQNIASKLLIYANPGDRVLIMLPNSLEYIDVFLGCLYAGIIGIPLYPVAGGRFSQRVSGIVKDCDAALIIVNSTDNRSYEGCQTITASALINTKANIPTPQIQSHSIAFLQYTSGSTGEPKGVMVSHENIVSNCRAIAQSAKVTSKSIFCNWLPFYHDLGMITTVMLAIYSGVHSVLMSPFKFTRRPICWLEAISIYKATHCAAPNFGYDH